MPDVINTISNKFLVENYKIFIHISLQTFANQRQLTGKSSKAASRADTASGTAVSWDKAASRGHHSVYLYSLCLLALIIVIMIYRKERMFTTEGYLLFIAFIMAGSLPNRYTMENMMKRVRTSKAVSALMSLILWIELSASAGSWVGSDALCIASERTSRKCVPSSISSHSVS